MKGNLFLNSDDQKFNFGLVFFGPPGNIRSHNFTLSLDDTFSKKTQGGSQIEPPQPF